MPSPSGGTSRPSSPKCDVSRFVKTALAAGLDSASRLSDRAALGRKDLHALLLKTAVLPNGSGKTPERGARDLMRVAGRSRRVHTEHHGKVLRVHAAPSVELSGGP